MKKLEAELLAWAGEAQVRGYCQHAYMARRYTEDCGVSADCFRGLKVLDIGCGPYPCLTAFADCERHGVDPLVAAYKQAGYLMTADGFTWHEGVGENLPFPDRSFGAVVCVNGLDHLDNLELVAEEIRRVLGPPGYVLFHVHYHTPTITEPQAISDSLMSQLFGWVRGLWSKDMPNKDCGQSVPACGERFVVWSNLEPSQCS